MEEVFVVDGTRTPFLKAGTDFIDLMAYQLGASAISALLKKNKLAGEKVDWVVMGTTVHNMQTSNVARECGLTAGIPGTTPCHTVTLACISANVAIARGIELIQTGQADLVMAGGTDAVSDIPITFPRPMRKKLFKAQKMKGLGEMLSFVSKIRPKDFKPEVPDIREFTTGLTMGQDCDLMADRFKIGRKAQDEFASRSHQLAAKAQEAGWLKEEISPVVLPENQQSISQDNGIRGDTSTEKIAKLRPAFDKKLGTLTAANSSFLTDGAAVVLLASKRALESAKLNAKAKIKGYVFTGQNPKDQLLLGPAFASPKVLKKCGLELDDIGVIEFHEAFAGQILSNLKVMEDDELSKKILGLDQALGKFDMDRFNCWGGSLSIGHPFGATGARLLTTASNRLHKEKQQYALLAACAGGAHGHAMIIEKV